MKKEHSPTPWRVDDDTHIQDSIGEYILSETERPDERGETYTAEDAAFIVKAVNCHDELVEAVEECVRAEEYRRKKMLDNAPASDYSDARIKRLKAAIAKAKS